MLRNDSCVFVFCLSTSCVLCAQCCQCLRIVYVLCLVCPMLPVSQDCLRPVSCVPNVASVSGLSSSCVLCTQCFFFQCLMIIFVLCLVCPMLPVSHDCLRPVSCVPNVASVSGLSLSCVLCAQCCQCLRIVFVLCLVCPMLPVSQDCPFLIAPSFFSNVYLHPKSDI